MCEGECGVYADLGEMSIRAEKSALLFGLFRSTFTLIYRQAAVSYQKGDFLQNATSIAMVAIFEARMRTFSVGCAFHSYADSDFTCKNHTTWEGCALLIVIMPIFEYLIFAKPKGVKKCTTANKTRAQWRQFGLWEQWASKVNQI